MMTPENTYRTPQGKSRCRTCRNDRSRESSRRKYKPVTPEERKYRTDLTAPKKCPGCGVVKSLDQFYKDKSQPDGHQGRCIECRKPVMNGSAEQQRKYRILRKYGITIEQYDEMLKSQDGGCAICHKTPDAERYGVLSVDHSHETQEVRGLLCRMCNIGLGQFEDDMIRLQEALDYLQKVGK